MTTTFSKGRSRLVILAVVAMIAALLAIPAAPAGAASAACDGAPSAGFTDLTGFTAETVDAVNCIAFYGITTGTTATTYGPNGDVSRWQMALFLTRKLAAAGVTLPAAADQGFTDIASFDAATKDAINQLAQLNITKGTSATTFDPSGIVNRWQMALFITRQLTAAGIALPAAADQGFTDIGTLDQATQDAINQLAALDISKGTSATTYDPMGNVNRWQMALFLARDLDAMGVVASGLTLSADMTAAASTDTVTLTVMVAADNQPVEGAKVDLAAVEEFNTDGSVKTYATDEVFDFSGGYTTGTAGTIDAGDPVTGVNGMVEIELTTADYIAHDVTIVAFTGVVGDLLEDAAASDMAKLDISWSSAPVDALFTTTDDATGDNVGGGVDATAPFGTSQSFTVQMLDDDGDPVAIAGESIQIQWYRYLDGNFENQGEMTVATGADGSYSLSAVEADPSSSADNDTYIYYGVRWDSDGDGAFSDETYTDVYLYWDDDTASSYTATLSGPDVADMDGFATVTVTVVDDTYGDPLSGAKVEFDWTNNPGAAAQKTLSSSGKASITVSGPGSNLITADDTVSVRVDDDLTTTAFDDPGADDDTHVVAWYDAAPDLAGLTTFASLLDFDAAANAIYVTTATANWKLTYDADDQFYDTGTPVGMAEFETAMKTATGLQTNPYDVNSTPDTSADVSAFNAT